MIRQSPLPDTPSTNDKPVVQLFVARASTPMSTSTVELFIVYNTDAERETAQNLATYLGGYKLASYRVQQVKGPSKLFPGGVYHAPEHERLAQSLASRTQSWLSKVYNQPITLTPRLAQLSRDIIIYLPGQN